MANSFNLDELESDEVIVIATIKQKDYAYNLLHSSAFDDYQKDDIDDELSDNALTLNRLNNIIHNLKMNQSPSPNPSMKEIQKEIDKKMELDGD